MSRISRALIRCSTISDKLRAWIASSARSIPNAFRRSAARSFDSLVALVALALCHSFGVVAKGRGEVECAHFRATLCSPIGVLSRDSLLVDEGAFAWLRVCRWWCFCTVVRRSVVAIRCLVAGDAMSRQSPELRDAPPPRYDLFVGS